MRIRLAPLAVLAVVLLSVAAPATAAPWPDGQRTRDTTLRLVALPGGSTLIHVHGLTPRHATVVSNETLAAVAVRDVDADGDLDIVASGRRGLLVWRNVGEGRFVLTPPHVTRAWLLRTDPGLRSGKVPTSASGVGEQVQPAALSPAVLARGAIPHRARASGPLDSLFVISRGVPAGRAPPVHS